MTHAADAFIRVTGEIAVASGTEGPGFTDMICGIACANAARTPLLVVASNMALFQEDTEAGIQLAYQQPTTEGMKKYGKRLITPGRVHEYAAYAFRQLRSGVPRPVHLDFPAEVASARFKDAGELTYYVDKARYRTESRPHPSPKDIDAAVAMLQERPQRPMIVSSNGVFYRRGWDALKRLAEKAQIPVVESGAMKGQFPDDHAALGQRGAQRARQRRRRPARRAALHADHRRVRVRPRRPLHPHRSVARRHRPQPADRSRHRQLRARRARGARRCDAADDARARGSREIAAARQQVRGAERRVLQDRRSSYTDAVHPAVIAQGAERLPVSRRAREGVRHRRVRRLRHRALHAALAARLSARRRS